MTTAADLLAQIYPIAIVQLRQLASQADFIDRLQVAFGSGFDPQIALGLQSSLQAGDTSFLPAIEIRTSDELAGANGAYDSTRDRILVAGGFLLESIDRPDRIVNLLLEEIGHKFDRLLNGEVDSLGDEGAIFAALAQGQTLSTTALAQLQAQDDHRILSIDGRQVAVELEVWTGTSGDDLHTGTAIEDTLSGLDGNDTIFGGAGNDAIDGGNGNDSLDGGAGNDTLLGGAGNDRLTGNAGTDYLDGGAGDDDLGGIVPQIASSPQIATDGDVFIGGAGFDRAVLRADPGGATINYTDINNGTISGGGSIKEVEYVFFYGDNGNDVVNLAAATSRMDAGGGNDVLTGGNGNDILIGGFGNDTLIGGNGNDLYEVDSLGDIVTENLNGGNDTINASITYTLGANVENLAAIGSDNISGTGNSLDNTIAGNSGDNALNGGDGNDTISGGAGNDAIEGGTGNDALYGSIGNDSLNGGDGTDNLNGGDGNDTLIGGRGDDIYDVGNLGDVITETVGEGIDFVYANVAGYTLAANVERLQLYGSANSGNGNALDNALYGNILDDTLNASDGNDYLSGGAGNDTLIGGRGDDTYDVGSLGDVITENSNEGIDLVYANISGYTIGNNVERLQLYGSANSGNGNALDNALYGNVLDDTLNASDGNDYISGGAGNDTLIGGKGDDTYDVGSLGDVITENAGEGIDLVYANVAGYTLADNVERLQLYGSANSGNGNALDNALYGNILDDTLNASNGNDYLNGGAGNDTLIGGRGDDTYDVGSLGDVITENSNEGIDLVYANISGYTIGNNVERLQLYGSANSGNGNSLDNALYGNVLDDTLNANDGNDYINGGAGNDTLIGGRGDDIYDVGSLGDVITETAGEGIDLVYANISGYVLGDNVEQLQLYGAANNGTGNASANILYGNLLDDTLDGGAGNDNLLGNAGNDLLIGGSGNDTLIGGIGNDIFAFNNNASNLLVSLGIDSIADFTVGQDKIQLNKSIFSNLTTNDGVLSIAEFQTVTTDADAATSTSQVAYNSTNGKLFYNDNLANPGLGTNGGQFAQLSTGLALTNTDFTAIGLPPVVFN
jgi:Ca2+-binding RTX toxin-like protein